VFQVPTKNLQICPFSWLEWAINPNYVTSLYADGHLITETWSLEFMQIPLFIEGCWLLDRKVSAIKCYFAGLSSILAEPVLQFDLKKGVEGKKQ
jgi:hypothetical protein